jgi:hypothetical protein
MNSPVIELSFNTHTPADENIAIPGNVRIVRSTSPSGPWTDEGGSGVFSPASPAGYATSDVTSINNPTYFALAYQSTPLPILLGSFDASFHQGVVELDWTTLGERDNAFFTIERSAGGLSYDSILTVPGAGHSHETLRYHAYDETPLAGISYYRLKQTDYDGVSVHSKPVRVVNPDKERRYIAVYPNPAAQQDDIFLKMVNAGDAKAYVVVASITGQIYFEGSIDLTRPVTLMSIMRYTPGKGVYIIKVNSIGLQETAKLFVH